MNTQTFIENFGHFAKAPGGMKRLREIILHFAVSGRLIPTSNPTLSAQADIEKAMALKAAYREKLKLREMAMDEPLGEADHYFPIPAHWKWVRLGNVASYVQRGKGPQYDAKAETRVVSQKCVQWSGFDLSVARTISDESAEDYGDERFLLEGDSLWNSTGTGTAGRIVEFPGSKKKVVTDSHVTIIRLTNFVPAYVRCFLASPVIQQRMEPGVENTLVTGTTNQVELPTSKVIALPIPCPPVEEQERIVARVDQLMDLCDRLEAQQQERAKLFPVLSKAGHDRFAQTPTVANLDRIFDEIGNVLPDDMRTTILGLAVRGKLVLQNPDDEPAAVLSKIKPGRHLEAISDDELPFGAPNSWKWSRLGSVAEFVNGDRGKNYPNKAEYVPNGVPFINTGHIQPDGTLSLQSMHYITRAKYDSLRSGKIQKGDLVYCLRGATLGKTAIIGQFEEGAIASSLVIIRLTENLSPRYVYYYLIGPLGRELITRFDNGSAQPNLGAKSVRRYVIPLPPPAEQQRIVAKVDRLMALVDALEKHQHKRDHLVEIFAKTVVASLTGTQFEERRQKMKAPKTELISTLKLGTKPKPKDDAPLAALLIKAKGEIPAKSLWQQSGLSIDDFYQQLKTELSHGWIAPPAPAVTMEVEGELP